MKKDRVKETQHRLRRKEDVVVATVVVVGVVLSPHHPAPQDSSATNVSRITGRKIALESCEILIDIQRLMWCEVAINVGRWGTTLPRVQ